MLTAKKLVIFIAILMGAQKSLAQVLIISDIDDTIKVSHVLDRDEALLNLFKHHSFLGMAELYQDILKAHPQASIAYITNAPKSLMQGSHQKFLDVNHFPAGDLMLSEKLIAENHKVPAIRYQIEKNKPKVLIMFGDNGEKDIDVYDQIKHEYANSGIRIETYIRIDYNSHNSLISPEDDQKTFVTSAEVALDLFREGLLPRKSALRALTQSLGKQSAWTDFMDHLHPGESLKLPDWVRCQEHQPRLSDLERLSPQVQILAEKINDRCQRDTDITGED